MYDFYWKKNWVLISRPKFSGNVVKASYCSLHNVFKLPGNDVNNNGIHVFLICWYWRRSLSWHSLIQSQQQKHEIKDTRMTSLTSFCCLYCYFQTDFTYCSGVSIVDFEQVNAEWAYKDP